MSVMHGSTDRRLLVDAMVLHFFAHVAESMMILDMSGFGVCGIPTVEDADSLRTVGS
jgi:hypothetical protein